MVKGNKQTTNDAASEIREIRALIERFFGEVNARMDKFDQTILELKEKIESSKAQREGGKGVEFAMNASSAGDENPSTLQEEENMKRRRKTLTATGRNEKPEKYLCVCCVKNPSPGCKCSNGKHDSLIEDESEDVVDVPTVDAVTTEDVPTVDPVITEDVPTVDPVITEDVPTVDPVITEDVPTVDSVATEEKEEDMEIEYSTPYEGGPCVTGYHGNRPLAVLIGTEETSHNFINESLADKLGCETFPIKPRTVRSAIGKMVTSRACNNFQLSLQGTMFILKMYLLPLSSNCDIVLGSQWLGILEKLILSYEGVEFYFQGKNQFVPFQKSAGGSKR